MSGKILFTTIPYSKKNYRIGAIVDAKGILQKLTVFSDTSMLNQIFLGRVDHVEEKMNAAFVELQPGVMAFMQLDASNRGNIKGGVYLPVQVIREPYRAKLASVSPDYSISGKYFVFALGNGKIHFSSKAKKSDIERISLFLIENKILLEDSSFADSLMKKVDVVVRTNALSEEVNEADVIDEFASLKDQFLHLVSFADKASPYTCLYKGENEESAFLSNVYDSQFDEIITDDEALLKALEKKYTKTRLYKDEKCSLDMLYKVSTQVKEALNRKVWLKSGGNLLIEQTEALTVIDVNSGKSLQKGKEQELFVEKINLEAATEIMHQLKLRNISGMILVDFVNMHSDDSKEKIVRCMKDLAKFDSMQTDIFDFTKLGLLEISRKKKNKPLYEQFGLANYVE